ncbi:hypothetical protein [Stygiolobus caldivivus]|uniref:Uncharacterized protein n=1 Tax=Stygiolobus caldivivus TaxID=2824673 RepID=A0A8D5ZKQ5_9CREN|nr:hypothetical protein [Stygiolobus caldivivus]BCU71522.1 hypothetical protein KN1_28190 [Stygiolobus caldivivus]
MKKASLFSGYTLSNNLVRLSMYEVMPCIVKTVTNQVITYDALRGLSKKIREKEEELVKEGIDKGFINDLAEDAENADGAICGSEERMRAYIEILYALEP